MKPSKETIRTLRVDMFSHWSEIKTDQRRGIPQPPIQKPIPENVVLFDLPDPAKLAIGQLPLVEALRRRKSHRQYLPIPINLEELSFLLWATQGVRAVLNEGMLTKRSVPSAGARHPFETYLVVNNVAGLGVGLYHYLPLVHKLWCFSEDKERVQKVIQATENNFTAQAAVIFIWTAFPYRTEWRYAEVAGKFIAQDSGHVCQNLYLACEAIEAGTCAVGAYNQQKLDELLGVDGEEELVVYCAPVGKV